MWRREIKIRFFLKENFFFLILILLVSAVAAGDWKGEGGVPVNLGTDIGFHAYSVWFSQHQIETGKLDYSVDFFTNTVFARTYPPFFYFLGGLVSVFTGSWNAVSIMVFLSLFSLSLGVFLLCKKLGLENRFAFIASMAVVLSFPLAMELRIWGSVTRVFAYALLPWLLLSAEFLWNGKDGRVESEGNRKLAFAALLLIFAVSVLTHPLTAAYFFLILVFWRALKLFFQKQKILFFKEAKSFALILVWAGLITSFFIVPLAFEKNDTQLSRYFSSSLQVKPQEAFSSLLTPKIFDLFDEENKSVSTYLGLSLVLLALAFAFSSGEKHYGGKNALFLFAFFFAVTLFPWVFSTLNQTVSRPAFFASFFLSVSAAFGARSLEKRFSPAFNKKRSWLPIIVIALAVFADLNPLLIPDPDYSFPLQPSVAYYYSTLSYLPGSGRFITTDEPLQDDVVMVSITRGKTSLYDPPERTNLEYSSFVSGLGFKNGSVEFENKIRLLNVDFVVSQMRNTAIINETDGVEGFVGKGVYLDFPSVENAEKVYETLLENPTFHPLSAVFILPKIKPENPDFVLTPEKPPLALAEVFDTPTIPFEVVFDERNNQARFTPSASGFAFVSLMHYPLWKAYSEGRELKVLEAGGGLIAVEGVEKGKEVVLRFEKPWYDYAGIALSMLGIALLAFFMASKRNRIDKTVSRGLN